MLFKKTKNIYFIFFIIFVLLNISITLSFASDKTYKLKLAQYQPTEDYINYQVAEQFIKRVAELSNGRIIINHYPGDLLGGWETQQIQVKQGSLDICLSPASATFAPELEFTRLPYIVFDWESAKEVYGFGKGGEDLIQEICENNNTHCLGNSPGGFLVAVSNKEFTPMPGDPSIAKVKARVMPSKIEEMIGRSLGFSTLSMPWGEIHSALMLGTIDAATGPDFSEVSLFKDVVKYLYNYRYVFGALQWIINLNVWNDFSEDDQAILTQAMTEALDYHWEQGPALEEQAIKEMEEAGVKIVNLTKEQMSENILVLRDKVWSWASDNLLSEKVMNKVWEFAAPIPH